MVVRVIVVVVAIAVRKGVNIIKICPLAEWQEVYQNGKGFVNRNFASQFVLTAPSAAASPGGC
jgi:hypothetical protein